MNAAFGAERNEAVRRLKPYPAYKDSGVEWLGEIPEHWELKPLKHLTAFSTGWTPPTGREDLYGGEHLWANIGDLGPKILTSTEKTISHEAVRQARLPIVTTGSLLFSFKLSVGTVSIAGADMYTNEAIARFGLNLGPEHRVTLGQMMEKLDDDTALDAAARVNTRENVRLTFDQKVEHVIQEIVDSNFELFRRITDDRKTQIVQGKTVCVVSCQRSPEPAFLKWKGLEAASDGDFFVRSGPGTVKLPLESAQEYIRTRFAMRTT